MSDSNRIAASLTLPAGFHFNQVKSVPEARKLLPLDFAPPLGAIASFSGSFAGKGFNLIFRPQNGTTPTPMPKPAHGPADNVLELNLTTETIGLLQEPGKCSEPRRVPGGRFPQRHSLRSDDR